MAARQKVIRCKSPFILLLVREEGRRLSIEEVNRCCENVKSLREQFIVPLRSSRHF